MENDEVRLRDENHQLYALELAWAKGRQSFDHRMPEDVVSGIFRMVHPGFAPVQERETTTIAFTYEDGSPVPRLEDLPPRVELPASEFENSTADPSTFNKLSSSVMFRPPGEVLERMMRKLDERRNVPIEPGVRMHVLNSPFNSSKPDTRIMPRIGFGMYAPAEWGLHPGGDWQYPMVQYSSM
jgi:hypothetical protein